MSFSNMNDIMKIQKILAIIARKNRDLKGATKVPVSLLTDENRTVIQKFEKEFNSKFSQKNAQRIIEGEMSNDELKEIYEFVVPALEQVRTILKESRVSKENLIRTVLDTIQKDKDTDEVPVIPTTTSTYQGIPFLNVENGKIEHITMDYHGKNQPNIGIVGRFFDYWIGDKKYIQCNGLGFRPAVVSYGNSNRLAKLGHISDLRTNEHPNYVPFKNGECQKRLFREYLESSDVTKEKIETYISKVNVLIPLDDDFDDMEGLVFHYSACFGIPDNKPRTGFGPSVFFDIDNKPEPISVDFDNTISKWQGSSLREDERSHIFEPTEFGKWMLKENNCIPWRVTTSRSSSCSFTGDELLGKVKESASFPELIMGISNPDSVLRGSGSSYFKSQSAVENGCYIHYDDDSSLIASGPVYIVRMKVSEFIVPPLVGMTETSHNPEQSDILSVVLTGNIGTYKSTVAKEFFNSEHCRDRYTMWFGHDSSRVSTPDMAIEIAEAVFNHKSIPIVVLMDQAEINFKPARKPGETTVMDKFTSKIQLVHDSFLFNLVEVLDRKVHDNLGNVDVGYESTWMPVRHSWDLHRMPITEVANLFIEQMGRTNGLKLMKDWCMLNLQRFSVTGNFFRITYMEGRYNARKTNDRAFHNARNLVVHINKENRCHIVSEGPPLTKEVSIADTVIDDGEALDNAEMDRNVHPKITHLSHVVEGVTDFETLIYDAKADGSTLKMMAIPAIVYEDLLTLETFTKLDRLISDKILAMTGGKWTIWYTSSGSYGLGQIVDKFVIWLYKNFGGDEDELRKEASHFLKRRNGSRKIHSEDELEFMIEVINRKIESDTSIINLWSSNIFNFFSKELGFNVNEYLTSNGQINHISVSFEILMKHNTGLFGRDTVLAVSSPITQLVWLGTVTTDKGWTRSTHSGWGFAIPYRVRVESVEKMKELHCYTRLVAEGRMLHEEFTKLVPSCNPHFDGLVETEISHEGWMIGFADSDRIIKGKGDFYYAAHKPWYSSSRNLIKKITDEASPEQLQLLTTIYPAVKGYLHFVNTFKWHSFDGIVDIANGLIPDSIFSKDKKPARKENVRDSIIKGDTVNAFKKCGKIIGTDIIPNALEYILPVATYKEMSSGSKGDRELIGILNQAFAEAHSCDKETFDRGLQDLKSVLFTISCRKA